LGDEGAGHAAGGGEAVLNEGVEDFLDGFCGEFVFGAHFEAGGEAFSGGHFAGDDVFAQEVEDFAGVFGEALAEGVKF